MALETHLPGVAGAIQLAIAPVFLLTAVGAFLNVMTSRLARAVDRARKLELLLPELTGERAQQVGAELRVLSRRARWSNRAIAASVGCAVFICMEVAMMFAGAFLQADVSRIAGVLFFIGIVALVIGLLAFLREIFIATHALKIGEYRPGF
ncbi:MAG TPA: DUF2721 domain-containing protein [Burkholderiales bacterium]|nr:DUF2721 domain-containing protein [Burkholderiales bacterium]